MAVTLSIHDYYMQQHAIILQCVKESIENPEKEIFHKLRLKIKKMMAFNLLADELCVHEPSEHIHISRKIKKLFKIAGKVRDLQVQLDYFLELLSINKVEYKRFIEWLQEKQHLKIDNFRQSPHVLIHHAIPPHFHEAMKHRLSKVSKTEIEDCSIRVFKQLESDFLSFQPEIATPETLHTLRMKVKKMRYLSSILAVILEVPYTSYIPIETLREIEMLVGNWHDRTVSFKMLRKYKSKLPEDLKQEHYLIDFLMSEVKKQRETSFNDSIIYLKKVKKEYA